MEKIQIANAEADLNKFFLVVNGNPDRNNILSHSRDKKATSSMVYIIKDYGYKYVNIAQCNHPEDKKYIHQDRGSDFIINLPLDFRNEDQ